MAKSAAERKRAEVARKKEQGLSRVCFWVTEEQKDLMRFAYRRLKNHGSGHTWIIKPILKDDPYE